MVDPYRNYSHNTVYSNGDGRGTKGYNDGGGSGGNSTGNGYRMWYGYDTGYGSIPQEILESHA